MISMNTLKKLFSDRPEKSTITFKGICSDCGCDVVIEISPTARGFGLKGGSLFEHMSSMFLSKCTDCFKANPTLSVIYKPKYNCTIIR